MNDNTMIVYFPLIAYHEAETLQKLFAKIMPDSIMFSLEKNNKNIKVTLKQTGIPPKYNNTTFIETFSFPYGNEFFQVIEDCVRFADPALKTGYSRGNDRFQAWHEEYHRYFWQAFLPGA